MKKHRLFIDNNGDLVGVHDDKIAKLFKEFGIFEELKITRASLVEPFGDKWVIYLPDQSGDFVIGTFNTREEAISVEIALINYRLSGNNLGRYIPQLQTIHELVDVVLQVAEDSCC